MNTDPRRFCLVTETYPPEINGVALTLGHDFHQAHTRSNTALIRVAHVSKE